MQKNLVALVLAGVSLVGVEVSATPPATQEPDFLFGAPRFTVGFPRRLEHG